MKRAVNFFGIIIILASFFLSLFMESVQAGSPQFLWKPSSEGDGKLVVLFPSNYRIEKTKTCKVLFSGGYDKPVRYDQTGANGDRIHARFPRSGSSYGRNVKVILLLKNGRSVKWLIPNGSQRFEKNGPGSGGSGGLDDTLGGRDSAKKAKINLTSKKPGKKSYTLEKDEKLRVSACLRTFGKASLKVTINGEEWITWKRSGDSDGSPLKVNGKKVGSSIYEENPGDFSAKASSHKYKGKAGDVLELSLKGHFGQAESYLRLFIDEEKKGKKKGKRKGKKNKEGKRKKKRKGKGKKNRE
ncbi:hypothetical protein ACFL35_19020 [Candidatus Riflebacteria bacterium]